MGHHFVPQRYLRNFENPSRPGFIWLQDKRGGAARLARIAQVAQAKRFYSPETEASLARDVETPGNAVIRKLTGDTAITPVERLQLAYYIGVMLKRIPARRRRSAEMIPGVLADVVSDVREQLKAIASAVQADPELLAQRLREVDAAESKFARQPPPEVLEQILEPWPSEGMLRALFGMTWRVLVSAGPQYFITTDNPAFFLRATQAIVKEINRRLASETERLAFYHEPAPWLLTILHKKEPYLSVIRWPNEPPNNRFPPKGGGSRSMSRSR